MDPLAQHSKTAELLRQAAALLRTADQLQGELTCHRLEPTEPIATFLEAIAAATEQNHIGEAAKQLYALHVAINKDANLDLNSRTRQELGRLLGQSRSEKKIKAAQQNGIKGGRPRKDGRPCRRKSTCPQ